MGTQASKPVATPEPAIDEKASFSSPPVARQPLDEGDAPSADLTLDKLAKWEDDFTKVCYYLMASD
jgi:hypothetical protein